MYRNNIEREVFMYSIAWPNMFTTASTNLLEGKAAIRKNLELLLNSERLSLFGDPYYGTKLKPAFFEQASPIIADLLIDEIYMTITQFLPQLYIARKDIAIYSDGVNLQAEVKCTYRLDNTSDLYMIQLTSNGPAEGI